ncbi:MAG: NADH-quinone oxidoreductase subunit M [Chloroflexi bacterium]|jgi:NADH-quinone oxidoreductase subunit M|nr:NADH-quinone oxidoreductase subunit M [Chloroflexota bacterium]
MQFPILSVLIFLPILTGVLLLFLPASRKNLVKWISLVSASLILLLSVIVYFSYDIAAGGYQLIERANWVPALGISYYVGIDGIGAPMVLLAGLVMFTGVLVSWGVDDRPREFFSFMMFLGASVLGVFCALDLFMLFFFFELAVFPKYLMIVLWGSQKTRNYGGMKLTLYLFIGSMIALVGALAIYFGSGLRTFDMIALEGAGFSTDFQRLWFPFVFLGFGILSGIFPFHSWAPDGHVAAPTAISMLLAGVEMKVGAYAALRVAFMLLPEGARYWSTAIMVLATINVVYGAFIALIQTDFKYVIGFSSVSHMGLVLIGFATLNREGLIGAGMQMFSHGVMTALFFSVVGMVYDRAHTRELSQLGGLFRKLPIAAVGFIIGGLVSMGMPGFSGFVAEFPIFMGVWQVQPVVAVIAILGVLITAAYILLVVRRVFFGELPEALSNIGDVTLKDKISTILLAAIMIALGIFPSLMAPMISSGVDHILALLGGA